MTAVVLIASMLVSSNGAKSYDATSAYSTCQVDALQGHHDAINGDCPNWEAWKAAHMQAARPAAGGYAYAASAASPRQRVYPTSHRRVYPTKRPWMPRDGVIIFRDIVGKLDVLRVECDKCGRRGSYPLDRLIERYGALTRSCSTGSRRLIVRARRRGMSTRTVSRFVEGRGTAPGAAM